MTDQFGVATCSTTFGATQKIAPCHLDRWAIVYVRQSSPQQVRENRESRERQYALREFAERLGWPQERIAVVDADQGVSGRSGSNRPGFQHVLAEVSMDHVGIVLGLELSRLSRSSKDWHHLVEVCAVFNTLLGDQDGLYDANDSNDRLLLGMKGAMSEFELITLRNRLDRGRDNKAARGDLILHVPIGYYKAPTTGEVTLEPDEESRAVVQLVFDKFRELGSAWRVFRYLIENNIELGYRCQRGANRGQLEWRQPNAQRITTILHHPMYAGAYGYGMHRKGRSFLPLDKMRVLIQNRFPAYISWEEYLENQNQLQQNRSTKRTSGTTRGGENILAGLVYCGRCGYRMGTRHKERSRYQYFCETHLKTGDKQTCHGLSARELDQFVAAKVLQVLEPASIQLSLQAADDIERERNRLHDHWRRRLEQARYDAERIERQYQAVEPENRRVARTLESRWEKALREEQKIREDYDRFLGETPTVLSEEELAIIASMCSDIRTLFNAPGTTAVDRKDIVRCLVERVDVGVEPQSEYVDVTIRWHGGFASQHEISRAVWKFEQLRDYDRLVERIRQLHVQGTTVPRIAHKLNEEGFVPPRRRGKYSTHIVAPLMKQLGLVAEINQTQVLDEDEWWVRNLALELNVNPQKIYYWIKEGWIHSRQSPARKHWIVWADRDELERLEQLKQQRASWTASRVPELTNPKPRQRSK
ncbi:MAG TPA: recombinase family protein [Planctomycetes bacterium]|nr:recombinase family protein [Planctomycetota bacterium]